MGCKIKNKGASNGGSVSTVSGHIGCNNVVKDMPCLLPQENMKMFTQMQKAAGVSSFGNYPNPFNAFWSGQK